MQLSTINLSLTRPYSGEGGGGAPATPATILGSDLLIWYDRTNLSSMFQDSAGTTPVTAGGQPVGKILDLSGNGHHAIQPTGASRALLNDVGGKRYLTYDGVDDSYYTASPVNLSAYTALTVFFAYRKTTNSQSLIYVEHTPHNNNYNGSFNLVIPNSTGDAVKLGLRGAGAVGYSTYINGGPADAKMVGAATLNLAPATNPEAYDLRVNGAAQTSTSGSFVPMGGTFVNDVMYFGRRANTSYPLAGDDYGFVLAAGVVTLAKKQAMESYLNAMIGAY